MVFFGKVSTVLIFIFSGWWSTSPAHAQSQDTYWSQLLRVHQVRKIQEALYNSGINLRVDGAYGPETRQAIAVFRRNLGYYSKEGLTAEELDRLLSEPTKHPWMSISYDGKGNYWPTWDMSSRLMATDITTRLCKRFSPSPHTCKSMDSDRGWIVKIFCHRPLTGSQHSVVAKSEVSIEEARDLAVTYFGLSFPDAARSSDYACPTGIILHVSDGIVWMDR